MLWALREWQNAGDIYTKVARTRKDNKAAGKYAQISAYNAILAYEKVVTDGSQGKLDKSMKIVESKKKGKSDAKRTTRIRLAGLDANKTYAEEEIPKLEQQLSDACDLYFKIADPKDKELPAIKFKAAYLYYKHNHFVSAAERYFEIIERWPGDPLAKKAANLILDSLNVQKKWDELAGYASKFKDNRRLTRNDKKFQEEVQTLLEGATYLSIQTAEKKARTMDGEPKETALGSVAERFSKFQHDFPESKYADKAIYSAVLIYNQADELDHAIEASELMKKRYPKSEQTQRNDWLLAEFYERIADFQTSAKLFDQYYGTYKKDKRAPDALYNSGIYYQGLGDTKQAIAQFTRYTKEFDKRDDAADVYWRICELHESSEDWKKAIDCYDRFSARYKKASPAKKFESRYRIAKAQEKIGQRSRAMKEYRDLVKRYPELEKADQEADGARLAASHAAFELLEAEWLAYKKMRITLRRQTLLKKAQTAEELACVDSGDAKCKTPGKYLAVLTYGNGDYGICALTRMGQVYREMALSIRGAPLPRRLSEDQLEIYRAELDSVALGPEEKAIGAFERALDKAYELNIYNECTLTAQGNLKELNPNKFPDLQKRRFRGAEGFIVAGIRAAPAPEPAESTPAAPEKVADPEPQPEVETSATGARK